MMHEVYLMHIYIIVHCDVRRWVPKLGMVKKLFELPFSSKLYIKLPFKKKRKEVNKLKMLKCYSYLSSSPFVL